MRRIAIWVAALILLGSFFNIAIAWACMLFAEPFAKSEPLQFAIDRPGFNRLVGISKSFGVVNYFFSSAHSLRTQADLSGNPSVQALLPTWATTSQFPDSQLRLFRASGWPLLSLSCEHYFHQRTSSTEHTLGALQTGLSPHRVFGSTALSRVLPVRPIWLGFLLNTLCYSLAACLILLAPRQLRRAIRLHRHQCPACGYALGTSPNCSECGAHLHNAPSRVA